MIQISRDRCPPPASFLAHSGGLVRDMLIHDLDELVWMFGDGPLTVAEQVARPRAGEPERSRRRGSDYRLCGWTGVSYQRIAPLQLRLRPRMEVFGSSGLVSCPNMATRHTTVATEIGFLRGPLHESFGERYAAAYEAELESFLDTDEGLAAPLCAVGDARMSLALAELVMEAHRTGTTVSSATLKRIADGIAAS